VALIREEQSCSCMCTSSLSEPSTPIDIQPLHSLSLSVTCFFPLMAATAALQRRAHAQVVQLLNRTYHLVEDRACGTGSEPTNPALPGLVAAAVHQHMRPTVASREDSSSFLLPNPCIPVPSCSSMHLAQPPCVTQPDVLRQCIPCAQLRGQAVRGAPMDMQHRKLTACAHIH
jgi:hypothetical protein